MKWLFLIVAAVVALFAYRTHMTHVQEEEDRVAYEKLDREHREKSAQREAELAKSRRPTLAITKLVDPLVLTVTGPLDLQKPYDYVPQLELTKQRVLDKQARAEPERKGAYDQAGAVFDALIGLADERAKLLEELLKNKAKTNPFDQPGKTGTAADFFNRSVLKRWDELLARYRPAVNQRLELLRGSERAWNAQLGPYSTEEFYDQPSLDPVVVTIDPTPGPPTGLGANSNGKVARPWRRSYYDQNGYRYPNSSR